MKRGTLSFQATFVDGIVIPFEELAAEVTLLSRALEAVPPVEVLPGGSSVEQIAVWIWQQLAPRLSGDVRVRLADGAFDVEVPA